MFSPRRKPLNIAKQLIFPLWVHVGPTMELYTSSKLSKKDFAIEDTVHVQFFPHVVYIKSSVKNNDLHFGHFNWLCNSISLFLASQAK